MKMITATELKSILANHKLWIDTNGKQGNFANLRGAYLGGANLSYANLSCVNLRDADLYRADLTSADLTSADLTGASLILANLEGADLRGANLYRAYLTDANLEGANLQWANLTGTIIDKKKEQGTTMILSEEETAAILKMRAEKITQAKIDTRDVVIEVITLVTLELSNADPSTRLTMQTEDIRQDIASENLETISQILDLMGLKFLALVTSRKAITFQYKKL